VDNIRYVQPCLAVSGASIVSAGPGLVLSPHNPEVTGSNPVPATRSTSTNKGPALAGPFRCPGILPCGLAAFGRPALRVLVLDRSTVMFVDAVCSGRPPKGLARSGHGDQPGGTPSVMAVVGGPQALVVVIAYGVALTLLASFARGRRDVTRGTEQDATSGEGFMGSSRTQRQGIYHRRCGRRRRDPDRVDQATRW